MKTKKTLRTMLNAKAAICMIAITLCLVSPQVLATDLYFDDSGVHDINYEVSGVVYVDRWTPTATTVNILDPAVITENLQAYNNSTINVYGGTIPSLYAMDISNINMSGGIIDDTLQVHDLVKTTITGGTINGPLSIYSSMQTIISGGSVNDINAHENSHLIIQEGSTIVDFIDATDTSLVDILGGTMRTNLWVRDTARIRISGSDFTLDGEQVGYGSLTLYEGNGILDGILSSGDVFHGGLHILADGQIFLVPEPSFMLVGGLVLLVVRRKRG